MAEVGGNAEEGRRIFRERADASCIRCHTVNHEGGIVGPDLDGIGSRQNREYLLESIVFPNAKIAPGFESAAVKLKDNKVVVGVVKSETGSELTLMDADGKLIRINKNEIAARKRGPSAMPEGFNQMLSLRDLRNLVEFLASLKQGGPAPMK
jgi:quinoprotein glucose dehydrogenase